MAGTKPAASKPHELIVSPNKVHRLVDDVHKYLNAYNLPKVRELKAKYAKYLVTLKTAINAHENAIRSAERNVKAGKIFLAVNQAIYTMTHSLNAIIEATEEAGQAADGLAKMEKKLEEGIQELRHGRLEAAKKAWDETVNAGREVIKHAEYLLDEIEHVFFAPYKPVPPSDQALKHQQADLKSLKDKIEANRKEIQKWLSTEGGKVRSAQRKARGLPKAEQHRKLREDLKKVGAKALTKILDCAEVRQVLLSTQEYWIARSNDVLKDKIDDLEVMLEDMYHVNLVLHRTARAVNNSLWSLNHYEQAVVKKLEEMKKEQVPTKPGKAQHR